MIHVAIADQRFFMGDSLRTLLEKQDDMCFVGYAAEVDDLHDLLPDCDIVLIYPDFVKGNTILFLNELHQQYPNVKLIPLELPDQPSIIVKYVEAGSIGYLLKKEGTEDMLEKIRAAAEGRALVSDKVTAVLMNHIFSLANSKAMISDEQKKKMAVLTSRQQQVMELICEGLTNQEIANRLVIETGTVKNHIHNILKKVGASNRQEAAILYQQLSFKSNGFARFDNGRSLIRQGSTTL